MRSEIQPNGQLFNRGITSEPEIHPLNAPFIPFNPLEFFRIVFYYLFIGIRSARERP